MFLQTYIANIEREKYMRVDEEGPLAVILAPVRELAQQARGCLMLLSASLVHVKSLFFLLQIEEEARKFCEFTGDVTVSVVGGASIHDQAFALRKGAHIVIGTPGRINDCLESRFLVLNQCSYVILDEADRMIDMGFEPQVLLRAHRCAVCCRQACSQLLFVCFVQVKDILNRMSGMVKSVDPDEMVAQEKLVMEGRASFRTTVMFSATMLPSVEKLAKEYMRSPVVVSIGDQESSRNKRIVQEVLYMTEGQKKNKLFDILRRVEPPTIVFVNIKKNCDVLLKALLKEGFNACVLHGGKSQDQREVTLLARALCFAVKLVYVLVMLCRNHCNISRMVCMTSWWPRMLQAVAWTLTAWPT
jgi:ATP-dependent RNA helicase DDX23/PRP28